MKTVAVVLVVVASALGWSAPTVALPPEDLASYCRATYPQVPFQIRCMSLERASQDRAAAARSAIDPTAWNRCQSGSASWSAMEACLAQPPPRAPGSVVPPAAGASEPADEQARRQPADGGAPAAAHRGPARRLRAKPEARRSAGGTARRPRPRRARHPRSSSVLSRTRRSQRRRKIGRRARSPKPRPIGSCRTSSSARARPPRDAPSASTARAG